MSREKHGVDEVASRGSASLISESKPASACETSSPSLSGVASPDGGPDAADRADADALPGPLYLQRPDFGGICQEQVQLLNATAISDVEMLPNIHIYVQE